MPVTPAYKSYWISPPYVWPNLHWIRLGLYWNTWIFGNFPRLKLDANLAIYESMHQKFDYIALDRLIAG